MYLQAGQECGLKVNFALNKTEVLLGKCADRAEMERRISNYLLHQIQKTRAHGDYCGSNIADLVRLCMFQLLLWQVETWI